MQVLTSKTDTYIIFKYYPSVTFSIGGKNTTTFQIGEKAFKKLYDKLKNNCHNPYRLMHW